MTTRVTLALWVCWAAASLAGSPPVPPWPALDPLAARRSVAGADASSWSDADIVMLDQVERARYAPDGTSTSWYESCILVLTEKGRRDLAQLSFKFLSVYATIEVARVEILKPDGRRLPIDVARTTRVAAHPDQMAENIYDPSAKLLSVGVPGVETGDVVHVALIERRHRVRVPDQWFDICLMEGAAPIVRAVYEVEAPAARPLRHHVVRDEIPGTLRYEEERWAGGTRHRWTATRVPRMFDEPAMPEADGVLQRVLVSTCEDWPSISRWYWNLCSPRMRPDAEFRALVAELVRDRPDERSRADALFTFVSQQIRYLGITAETEAPGYEPHDVTLTLRQRHGVCRDKAALLAAMASEAGLGGFPVLIHAGPLRDPQVPMPHFNHAIAAIRFSDGAIELLDPTDEATRDWLPAYLAHRSYLMASSEGEPLRTSPVPPAVSNVVRMTTESELSPDGDVRGRCDAVFFGINDNAYRNHLVRRSAEERRRLFETAAQFALPGCQVSDLELDPPDLRDRSRPLRARWRFQAPAPVVHVGPAALVAPPFFAAAFGVVHRDLDALSLEQRRFPLRLRSTGGVEETLRVRTAPVWGTVQSVPPSRRMEIPSMRWSADWEPLADGIAGRVLWHFNEVEISPRDYPAVRDAVRAVVAEQRRRVLFHRAAPPAVASVPPPAPPPPPTPDINVIHHATDVTWLAPGTWAVTNEVIQIPLTYAGVKACAEIKLPYLDNHDEARLLFAEVISPEGATNLPGPLDVQIMDQAWTAAAPRYPAGRVLVGALPAVTPGARIRFRTLAIFRNRPFFAEAPALAARNPVRERIVRLHVPTSTVIRVAEPPAVQLTRRDTITNGIRTTIWRAEDIPPTPREPAEPPPWLVGRCWLFGDGDWREYARRLDAALRKAVSAPSDELTALARRLAPDTLPLADRIRAIRDTVAQHVRDAGPNPFLLPLDELSTADRVWMEGYGHSADRAVLLFAMLRAIGLEPEWVPATPLPRQVAEAAPFRSIPWLAPFDRLLIRVRDADGRSILLNDTDHYAALGASPSWGNLALDLSDGRIIPLPEPAEFADLTEMEFEIELDPDGAARIVRRSRFYGMHHAAYVREIRELTPEELRRRDRAELAAITLDADPEGAPIRRLDEHPASEEFRFRIPRLAQQAGSWWYVEPPLPRPVWPGVQGDARMQPLYWERPIRERISIRLRPPPNVVWLDNAPLPLTWSATNFGRVAVASRHLDDGSVQWSRLIEFEAGVKPASTFHQLRELLQQLRHLSHRTWVGRVARGEP